LTRPTPLWYNRRAAAEKLSQHYYFGALARALLHRNTTTCVGAAGAPSSHIECKSFSSRILR